MELLERKLKLHVGFDVTKVTSSQARFPGLMVALWLWQGIVL